MKVSVQKRCPCNNRLYINIKAHRKSQKHQLFELKEENKHLRVVNKRQENEIFALKRALMKSMERNLCEQKEKVETRSIG